VLVVPLSSMATSFTLGGMNVPLSNPTIDTQKKIKIYTLDANSNSEIVKYTGYTRQVSISLNNDQKCRKPQVTWKQHPNIAASTITEHRRQSTIRCANGLIKRNPVYLGKTLLSNRINAKPVCSWYNPVTCKYETVKGPNPLTQSCQRTTTLPIKSRLGYTRINKNWCNTTKSLTVNNSASDQIAKRKQRAFLCPCGPEEDTCSPECDGENNIVNLSVEYPVNGGIGKLSGPDKLCRCDTTFILNVKEASGAIPNGYLSPINPVDIFNQLPPPLTWDDITPQILRDLYPGKILFFTTDLVTFKIPPEWCTAGYKKLYLFEESNPPTGLDGVTPASWDICAPSCENQKRQKSRYCYPRPMATGKCRGLIDFSTKSTVACLRKAQCNK
jgi:hypothetical protein